MDLQRLERIARAAGSRTELLQLVENVKAKKDEVALRMVNEILMERFPVAAKSRTGATPTTVRCGVQSERFENGKQAYLWLLEQFRMKDQTVFERFVLAQRRSSKAKGSRFAKSIPELFPPGSTRVAVASFSSKLGGGWFTDVNLDHEAKFATLLTVSRLAGMDYPKDWDFQPEGSTEELRQHQEAILRAEALVAEFLREA
jgi:hypothetical protein